MNSAPSSFSAAPIHTPGVAAPPPTNHSRHTTLIAALLISLTTFGLGITGSIGYYKYFNDSVPLPRIESAGLLLGMTDESGSASPSASPTPIELKLKPEKVEHPLAGTIAYLKNHQLYTIKADRSLPMQLTTNDSEKSSVVVSPDGLFLAYTSKPLIPELTKNKAAGIDSVNRQTKEVKTILPPDKFTYSHLQYSPSGKYLSAWVNEGLEAVVIDINAAAIITRYGTPDVSGISPIVWVPGSNDRISFILKNELFTANPDGTKINSITSDVLAIKPQDKVAPLPLPPVWSKNGTLVAYHRTTGIFIFDMNTKQEVPVATVGKALEPAQIPWQIHAFNDNASHLLYEDSSVKDNQTTLVYSLLEKKNVSLTDSSDTILLNGLKNEVISFPPPISKENTLEKYSLSSWKMTSCGANDFRFIRPALIPASTLPPNLSPDGIGLIGLSKSAGTIVTVKLMNMESCDIYELVKDMSITEILWLPN